MTKRILAIIMALVMSFSILSVVASAATAWGTPTLTYDPSKKTMTITWGAHEDATGYTVTLYRDGTSVGTRSVAKTATSLEVVYNNITAGGVYKARVEATRSSDTSLIADSNSITVPSTSTSGNVSVTSTSNGAKVEWAEVKDSVRYVVDYTYYDESSKSVKTASSIEVSATSTSYDITGVTYANLRTVTVSYVDASFNKRAIATVNVTNGGGSVGTGSVNLVGNTLYWSATGTGYYTGNYVINGSRYNLFNTASNYNYTNNTTADVTNIINYCKTYNIASVTFEIYVYGTTNLVGTYTYSVTNNPSYIYGIYVVPNTNGTVDVSWSSYTNATAYYVQYTVNGTTKGETVTTTSYSFVRNGSAADVIVYAVNGNQIIGTVGQASIAANGTVTGNGQTSSSTPTTPGTPGTTGNVVTGYNCYLTVGTTSSTLQFTTNVVGPYSVLVVPVGEAARTPETINATTITIPYGSNTSFVVYVFSIATNERVAEASWTAKTTPANAKTEVKNLTATLKNSSTTTLSWTAVSGASVYDVEYAPLGSSAYFTESTRNTTFDLVNYGKNVSFEAYVYAWVNSRRVFVGSVTHVAGDDYPAADDKKEDDKKTEETKPADTTPAYVTNFKGTVGTSGSITLSWNAASGKPTYEIYYKKTGTTTWKKLYSTTARSLKVNKLTNGTSYDFKVMANGNDSGVLSMTIGTTSSTKTAPDPGETTSNIPSIIATSGGNGTLTVSWNAVKNGTTYRVYIAEDGTTTYKTKTSAWSTSGTSLTLTGLEAGTYKVRIKASTDNGKTWTNLSDCDYRTVTVK